MIPTSNSFELKINDLITVKSSNTCQLQPVLWQWHQNDPWCSTSSWYVAFIQIVACFVGQKMLMQHRQQQQTDWHSYTTYYCCQLDYMLIVSQWQLVGEAETPPDYQLQLSKINPTHNLCITNWSQSLMISTSEIYPVIKLLVTAPGTFGKFGCLHNAQTS